MSSSKAQKNSNALDGPLMVGKVKADIKEMTGTFKGGYTLYAICCTRYMLYSLYSIRYTLYAIQFKISVAKYLQ